VKIRSGVQVRLLGPVELWNGALSIRLGPPRQRCVLAVLAVTPGQPVALETLVDRVWGQAPPANAREALYSHVSRLRTAVRQAGGTLRRRGGGYVLEIGNDRVDLHRSRRLAAEARALPATPASADQAARLWREACELWRAAPLTGLPGDWADRMRDGLEQEWLSMLVERFETELRRSQPTTVIGPLSAALAEHPLAEPLAGLLMRALYEAGRPADALAVYARLRQRLAAELGEEPGAPLRELHRRVLRREPAPLQAGRAAPGADGPAGHDYQPARPVVPAQLPAAPPRFVGRAAQLARMDATLSGPASPAAPIAIEGMAGVGKTALAMHWAHRVRDRFPDGQLYVDMCGHAAEPPASPLPPAEVLARFLRALGVPAAQLPAGLDEAVASYRSLLADRRVLVVLDNVADPDQARPVLPGGRGCAALVTSRGRLTGLVAREGAVLLELDVLSAPEAVALLAAVAGRDSVAAEPSAAAELVELCGRLPLALRIGAANLAARPGRTLASYVSWLRGYDRLAALAVDGDRQAAVGVAFDASYRRLAPPAARMFRLLGLVPGPDLAVAAAAALAGIPPSRARLQLAELASAHLLDEHRPGRYACHDLLRVYACDRADADEPVAGRRAALDRLYRYYHKLADAADRLLYPQALRAPSPAAQGGGEAPFADLAEALGWLDAECANLVTAVRHAATIGPVAATWPLADALRGYLLQRAGAAEGLSCLDAGVAAAEAAGEPRAQARLLLARAGLNHRQGHTDGTVADLTRAGELSEAAGWPEGQGAVLSNLGTVHSRLGRLDLAVSYDREALALNERLGSRQGHATALGNLAFDLLLLGRLREAAEHAQQAARAHAALGARLGEATCLATAGRSSRLLGDLPGAVRQLARARSGYRSVGDRGDEASALGALALVYCDAGRTRRALALSRAARWLAEESGHRGHEASSLTILAIVELACGRYASAHGHARRALELARRTETRDAEVEALLALAAAQQRSGTGTEARRHAREALAISRRSGYRLLEGRALTVLAETSLADGQPDRATAHSEAALEIHRETGYQLGQAVAQRVLAAAASPTAGTAGTPPAERVATPAPPGKRR
jgi:DNA-binding SARP family transcriptional activator/tetratricopeptide (TPR) repeat protein